MDLIYDTLPIFDVKDFNCEKVASNIKSSTDINSFVNTSLLTPDEMFKFIDNQMERHPPSMEMQ